MAKTGFWLRNAKGKLAGATIYQQNGETVMREVVSPSNPKTEKQNMQRIIMHTVMQAYSKMKEITDHSFESLKKGQDTMSYFMKQNIQFCREKVANMQESGVDFYDMYNFVPLGLKGFTPNQYQVSMGSLPKIEYALPGAQDPDTTIVLMTQLTKANPTYGDVISALGLQRGDQLTFLVIDSISAAPDFGQNDFIYCRVILDPTNEDYSQASLDTPFLTADGAINKPSVRNENTGAFTIIYDNLHHMVTFKHGIKNVVGACVIASREVNKVWLRSTQYLVYRGGFGICYNLGECMDRAASGTTTQVYAPSEQYLNNAGTGGGIAAETGENSSAGSNTGGNSGSQSGGGSQSSSGEADSSLVTACSMGGLNATKGTTRQVGVAANTEFPYSCAVVVTTAAGANGMDVFVSADGGTTKLGRTEIASSPTSFNVEATENTLYRVYLIDSNNSVVDTGFAFQVSKTGSESTI